MPTDSTAGDTASQDSRTKRCWDALQAAEATAFISESSTHNLNIFSDHGRKGTASPEHARKSGLPVRMPVVYISSHRLRATPFPCIAPAGVCLWNID